MPTIRTDRGWLRFEQHGAGPAVLLVADASGRGAERWERDGWLRTLARSGRRAVVVVGRAPEVPDGGTEAPDDAEVAPEELEELLRYANARRLDVVAAGPAVAATLALAARRPGRVRGLVLLDPGHGLAAPTSHATLVLACDAGAGEGPVPPGPGPARQEPPPVRAAAFLSGLPEEA